ncbi:Uncharacterized protein DAT39_000086 [Clarias magur]|uniref:Uncharacterized protein n=1 Tax=Clarias magur TaxID=1594786 RepID=A0A8J4XL05_CLAMG|nr:Uncharacterized protein DAT39_000086 [Clarias magur]
MEGMENADGTVLNGVSLGSRWLTVFDSHGCSSRHWSRLCPMEHRVSNRQSMKRQRFPEKCDKSVDERRKRSRSPGTVVLKRLLMI